MELRRRDPALDLVRVVAVATLLGVHFFLNTGFYSELVVGKRMFVMVLMRTLFMVCVPLFLILTGYLMNRKTLSRHYYAGVRKTLAIYLLASLACLALRVLVLHQELSILGALRGILDFTADGYAWYIEMYLGLFLLIPFLNLIYNGLTTRRGKRALLLTLLLLTALPPLVNSLKVAAAGQYVKLIPGWWAGIYPITYYFIGCYLSEFKPRLKGWVGLLLLAAAVVLFGGYNFYRSYQAPFAMGAYQDWGALFNVVLTGLLFLLLSGARLEGLPRWGKTALAKLSDWSLGAYLCSFIADQLLYPRLNAAVPYMPDRLNYFLLLVLLSFVCSMALSALLNGIYHALAGLFGGIRARKPD